MVDPDMTNDASPAMALRTGHRRLLDLRLCGGVGQVAKPHSSQDRHEALAMEVEDSNSMYLIPPGVDH